MNVIKSHRIFFTTFRTLLVAADADAPAAAASEQIHIAKSSKKPNAKKMDLNDTQGATKNWAVLRYTTDESGTGGGPAAGANENEPNRFKLTISYKSKQFNFDRSLLETPLNCTERIKANFMKKFGPKRLGFDSTDEASNLPISFVGIDESIEFGKILGPEADSVPNRNLQLKIFDELLNIDLNPPEVINVKFLKKHQIGYPIVPIKFDRTESFSFNDSKYFWEAAPKRSGNSEVWNIVSESLVFIPSSNEVGMFLKLTIVPSDGKRFGPPLTIDVPGVVRKSKDSGKQATDPILFFEERQARLKPKTNDTIRVISYNILSEELCTPEWFTKSPKESLEIDYRLPLLNAELVAYDGDIYCFQEMDQKHFDANYTILLSHSSLTLQGLFSCKSGNIHEGLATFFNPSKFRLIDSHPTVDLKTAMNGFPFYHQLKQQEGLKSLFSTLEGRGNVLQVVLLECIENPGKLILVANTHLYWKPEGDHVRLLQTITCITYIENLIKSYETKFPEKSITTLFCGDFNCTPPYSSVRLLETGSIAENDFDWTSHETEKVLPGLKFNHTLKFSSAFPNQEITCIMGNFEGCIDYVWYQPEKLELLSSYPPPSKTDFEIVSLPNFSAPSDHLPLIADFYLR